MIKSSNRHKIAGLARRRPASLLLLALTCILFWPPAARALDTWSQTGSLLTAREGPTATRLSNGQVLAVGGFNTARTPYYLASAELYNPATGTWTETGSLNTPRYRHTATLLANGKVLVVGGDNNGPLASAELYDPNPETWNSAGSLATSRYDHTATLLADGRVLVVGGITEADGVFTTLDSCELYDPDTNSWSSAATLNNGRDQHTATLLPDGQVLVAGGHENGIGFLKSAELYDPEKNTWTLTDSLKNSRDGHAATLLPNGKVLVAAGFNGGYPAIAELYDPETQTWTNTGSLKAPRNRMASVLLANGNFLLVGGYNPIYGYIADCELYDRTTGTWSLTNSLNIARGYLAAALLVNGQVLAAGGYNNNMAPREQAIAELYGQPMGLPLGALNLLLLE